MRVAAISERTFRGVRCFRVCGGVAHKARFPLPQSPLKTCSGTAMAQSGASCRVHARFSLVPHPRVFQKVLPKSRGARAFFDTFFTAVWHLRLRRDRICTACWRMRAGAGQLQNFMGILFFAGFCGLGLNGFALHVGNCG